jgi:transcriptional regulator with XRE-family HTH domain
MSRDICRLLGKRIVTLRRKYGFTQEELAERSGVSYKYVQMLEGKKPNNVSLKVMEKLAKGFNIPPWKLLKF